MRFAAFSIGMLLIATAAAAQTPCAPQRLSYDPYKPSHLAIMREYGGTMLAQAPLSTLLKLDAYVPSQGELLRQLGRGIPIWATWYPYPSMAMQQPVTPSADCAPPVEQSSPATPPLTTFAEVMARLERERVTTATPSVATVGTAPGERIQGLSIRYAGRAWVSAGAAVPFQDSAFTRIGESAGFEIFRRANTKDEVIFVPTTAGMVAPFRMAR